MATLVKHGLDQKNKVVRFSRDDWKTIHQKAKQAISHADNGVKRNSLRHIIEKIDRAIERSEGIGAIPASERIFQLKITLKDIEPPIWRRIQVRDCTLDRLHQYIQLAFGWWNYHLHEFRIQGQRYGDPQLLDDGTDDFEFTDSTLTRISQITPWDGKRFRFEYEYDFGDGWQHEILFEGCLWAEHDARYPLCLEGERACPPEDVGGPLSFANYLEAMADPEHDRHNEFWHWRGPFAPEAFDAEKTTKKMRRGLPKWRDEIPASVSSRDMVRTYATASSGEPATRPLSRCCWWASSGTESNSANSVAIRSVSSPLNSDV